jgi:hypothetical protein
LTNHFSNIDFCLEDDKFFIEYASCGNDVGNLREESEKLALSISEYNKDIIISLSSGLDGQIVLHSFYSQNIPVKVAFMHLPGFNDIEFDRVHLLKEKYKFNLIVKELDPNADKDELLKEYEETKIPPYQLLHKKFLSSLPTDDTFIQGLDGPDFYYWNDVWNIIQTPNSFVNSRTRAFRLVQRKGVTFNWERNSNVLLSVLQDDIVVAFLHAYNNIVNNDLIYTSGKKIPIIDHYDLYIKPFIYAKYWKDELEYFPKYQGCEGIDWIMNNKWHQYRENVAVIPLDELVKHLRSSPDSVKRYYQK